MLFLASPGTDLAQACARGEANSGDAAFMRRDLDELEALFPGNPFRLPPGTLCWTHPCGLCVSPLEPAIVCIGASMCRVDNSDTFPGKLLLGMNLMVICIHLAGLPPLHVAPPRPTGSSASRVARASPVLPPWLAYACHRGGVGAPPSIAQKRQKNHPAIHMLGSGTWERSMRASRDVCVV